MAETHPLRTGKLDVSSEFKRMNREAEEDAKRCPTARMPSLDHLCMADFEVVYEPSDDSFLLVDALAMEFVSGAKGPKGDSVKRTLEIGCGTGVATVYLAQVLRQQVKCEQGALKQEKLDLVREHYMTDINEAALRIGRTTAEANGIPLDCIKGLKCDLATPLLGSLGGLIDVLIFNPPYVPTPDDEVGGTGIEASWAGGTNGRLVVDRALPQIAQLLSWPNGVAYMITVDDNMPEQIAGVMMKDYGIIVRPLLRRKARNEYLTVQKLTLTKKLDFGS
mmetsp:Transcript_24536/g.45403  ORF Transcript_24536/g.45403 Transcript_24536/m.45403 type:complete len:278 (-) Transcript_24536:100-933(-)|eukprot:CAMPEP_0197451118 /NCGR_PEP_ID=MMETSP1175-20131217/27779_1 /TAXON_ID=1003142 /ORGANISM="Triceratium dubium, Strain CCMP147" /LENGTH=277 /DNA_ID=CAMNT_0042983737 /DNA_START=96 /DNA_END=929 /DNA_ORIENTATION=-